MTLVVGMGRKIRKARGKVDQIVIETDRQATIYATKTARLATAADRAEDAAVRFLRDHQDMMNAAARARHRHGWARGG